MNDIFQEILISLITGAISSLVFTSISYFAFLHKIPEKTYEKIEKLLNDRLGYETTNHNAVMGALNPNNEVLLNLVSKDHRELKVLTGETLQHLRMEKAAKENREHMISFAREGDKVVCSDISRIARNTRDLLTIIDELQKKGVAFQSLKESIDTSTPQGQFMLTVFGALAQLERDCIRQRTEEGRRIAMQEGRITGRPKVQVDKKQFLQVCVKWRAHEITAVEAQKLTGLTSSTFYRHVKEMKI